MWHWLSVFFRNRSSVVDVGGPDAAMVECVCVQAVATKSEAGG